MANKKVGFWEVNWLLKLAAIGGLVYFIVSLMEFIIGFIQG
jgi:hypothetical protein